jgi:AcrR family transcriptional regulator
LPKRNGTRDRILAAAMEVAKESGAGHLSLDAIARRAGVSKGGLLYHFPKKDALIRALVEHHLAGIESAIRDAEAEGGRSNAVARAFVEVYRNKIRCQAPKPSGVLVALAEDPQLLEPVRAHQGRVVDRIRHTEGDRGLSLIAFLVVEGLNALDLFEADPLTAEERDGVLDTLLRWLDEV